jgi:hypothetical protein
VGKPIYVAGQTPRQELVGQWVLGLEESLAYHQSVVLVMVRLARKGNRWLLIVAGTRAGKHIVAYYECGSIPECYEALVTAVKHNKVDWRADKYSRSQRD